MDSSPSAIEVNGVEVVLDDDLDVSSDEDVLSEDDAELEDEQYFEYIEDFQAEASDPSEEEPNEVSSQPVQRIIHQSAEAEMDPSALQDIMAADYVNGKQCLDLFQKRFSIDYGRKRHGSRAADATDEFFPTFHLDMICIIGEPMKPIARQGAFFENVNFTLQRWQAPYAAKHIKENLGFELTGRTFRLATSSTREQWFVVMHPIDRPMTELPDPGARRRKRQSKPKAGSAVSRPRAEALASYIKQVFLEGSLLGEGIEPSWRLNRNQSRDISGDKWARFQELFMQCWETFVLQHSYDCFWQEHLPAFHAYDFGANRELETTDAIRRLPRESTIRTEELDSDDSETDEEGDSRANGRRRPTERELTVNGSASARPYSVPSVEPSDESLLTDGLHELRSALEQKYDIGSISMISYALAANLNCVEPIPTTSASSPSVSGAETNQGSSMCMLADFSNVLEQYTDANKCTTYSLGFHPRYGNFTSRCPPRFLQDVCTVMGDNMRTKNNLQDILSFGFFQGYSNIKPCIRSRAADLLATKGVATAALTLPVNEAKQDRRALRKQQRLLNSMRGKETPDTPEASIPFARERQRLLSAIDTEEHAYRMEQVITVKTSHLVPSQRNYTTVLRPILQLMRLFINEKASYLPLLRVFRPELFPGILCSFARMFELALGEMDERCSASGDAGLTIALAEGTAALDRLGAYCFTGDRRVLQSSVLRPLGTMESLQDCAWPFVDPDMLNMCRAPYAINVYRWPCGGDKRPMLLHVAAIAYHYNEALAANRQSQVWFGQWQGRGIRNLGVAMRFLKQLFGEVWVPEMVTFLFAQLRKSLGRGRMGLIPTMEEAERIWQAQEKLEAWRKNEGSFGQPFDAKSYASLFGPNTSSSNSETTNHGRLSAPTLVSKTRDDFAQEVYALCVGKADEMGGTSISPKHATWFPMLCNAVKLTPKDAISPRQWVDAISGAIFESNIEWLPGSHRQKLTSKRAIRLVGSCPSTAVILARPGTMKRKALEADLRQKLEDRGRKRVMQMVIDFGEPIPFTRVPALVAKGFITITKTAKKELVRGHYDQAWLTLSTCLGDYRCDLMLMLVLTLAASTRTPVLEMNGKGFTPASAEASKKQQKDPAAFAATLVVRMLWALKPKAFSADKDDGSIMNIKNMTTSIEHKGVSNRMLLAIGWLRLKSGNRETPRHTEVELNYDSKLLQMKKDLMQARGKPEQFISMVFKGEDKTWSERCESIKVVKGQESKWAKSESRAT